MTSSQPLRIGLIGYGYWGQNLLRNLVATSGLKVTRVVDLEAGKAERIEKSYPDIRFSTHLGELIEDKDIDGVVIATPIHSHFELAKMALTAGKHVLLEKPATVTTEQADELIAIARKNSCICLVDHTYLFTPAVLHMKKVIDANEIGDIRYIDSVRINLGLVQTDVNVLWDLAVHDISIALYLMSERPVAVRASAGVKPANSMENVGYLTLVYPSDKLVHVSCSWASPVKIRHMVVSGTRRMILFNDLEPSEKIKIYDSGYEVRNDDEKRKIMIDYRVGDIFIPQLSKKEALAAVCEEFRDCILTRRESRVDLERAKSTVSILAAAQLSVEQRGAEVQIQWDK